MSQKIDDVTIGYEGSRAGAAKRWWDAWESDWDDGCLGLLIKFYFLVDNYGRFSCSSFFRSRTRSRVVFQLLRQKSKVGIGKRSGALRRLRTPRSL